MYPYHYFRADDVGFLPVNVKRLPSAASGKPILGELSEKRPINIWCVIRLYFAVY